MARHTKLYDKSPKAERDEDGNMKVKKAEEKAEENQDSGAGPGEDGSGADMTNTKGPQHKEMVDRHLAERKDMHDRHVKEHADMHKRHNKEVKEFHGEAKDKEEGKE